ncbi:MAG TPA: DUF1772 domain-containing protein [Edaphobacter sp.]
MHLLDITTITIIGLMVGNELTVSLFINPVMRQLDPATQARPLSLFAALLGRVMPFWYILCLALLLTEAVLRHSTSAFPGLLAATGLWIATILYTVLFLVPINNRIAALQSAHPIADWIPQHERWNRLHIFRIATILIALILTIHALLPPL